ncbi:MAG: queuosine salvage family protein [Candidatus Sericytochromatia bacterium]|nr:queuosine salvage family protein [Candidatus Sericytochromatia bacterium]
MGVEQEIGNGILPGVRFVMQQARHVSIERAGVQRAADEIVRRELPIPGWNATWHFTDGSWRTAHYLLVLDALNFSFWARPDVPRWGIDYAGQSLRGYWALAAALKRAIEAGYPLYEASFMADCPAETLAGILAGRGEIPLFEARLAHLHEVGQTLLSHWEGRFTNFLAACEGSAVRVAERLPEAFPSFRDESLYAGRSIRLAKRAQILPADLWGAFAGEGPGRFHDIDGLTAFADYKVPQVLEALGVLRYSDALVTCLTAAEELPAHGEMEVELRAATILGVEILREVLAARGRVLSAVELDWILWELGLSPDVRFKPYHLTRTTAY